MTAPRSARRPDPSPAPASDAGVLSATARAEPALVARIRAGDTEAFKQLFMTYYDPLCAFVAGYVGSAAVAEEQVQDVLLWVWDQRADWLVRSSVQHYLYGAARNRALNWLRRQRMIDRWEVSAAADLQIAGVGQGPAGSEDALAEREFDSHLAAAVARLPERRRQAFALRWQQGMSYADIAQVMGITTKGVEKLIALAFAALRAELRGLL
jgi:RNA polymerase sigma-70 factor (ECF subfamily)